MLSKTAYDILALLVDSGRATNTEIATRLHLDNSTVSRARRELEDAGLVVMVSPVIALDRWRRQPAVYAQTPLGIIDAAAGPIPKLVRPLFRCGHRKDPENSYMKPRRGCVSCRTCRRAVIAAKRARENERERASIAMARKVVAT